MSDTIYCYPGTNVLINHFNIRDIDVLEIVERDITSMAIALLTNSPVKGNFTLKHLQDIHYAIFHELYPFAGQIREVAIAKSNLFCLPQFIRPMADEIFQKLHRDNCLRGLDKETFIDKLAFYSAEINALHPFREGNGRSLKLFLQELAKQAGYQLEYLDKDKQLEADIESMSGRYDLLKQLYSMGVTPIVPEITEKNISEPVSVLKLIADDREKRKSNRVAPLKTAKKTRDDPEL